MADMLRASGISKRFGALTALDGVDLRLEAGARHALIGPNGAGKTTLIGILTGALAADAGEVFLGGRRITPMPQHARARRGLTRTYQVTQLFPALTVMESVMIAVLEREGHGWRPWRAVASFPREVDEARGLLASLGLERDAGTRVDELPYGRQRLVEIAIALGLKPKVLLLDEPAAGVPSQDSHHVLDVLGALPADIAILIIEHDMDLVFRFASRITVLVQGQILVEGTPQEIAADRRVRDVYLGEATHA
jgi:branched-chain amino acid transport system ATP-binding protein